MIKFKKILMLTLATTAFAMHDNEEIITRPWGNFYLIYKISDTERLIFRNINAYAVTSLHYHKYRDEAFTVHKGSGVIVLVSKDNQVTKDTGKEMIAHELVPTIPFAVNKMTIACVYNSNPYPVSFIEKQTIYNKEVSLADDVHRLIHCEDMIVYKDINADYRIVKKTQPYILNKCNAFRDNIGW